MSSQQLTTKRIKLAGAFSTVPAPRVEVPSIASTAVTATKTAVYTMPPAIAKYDSGIPVAGRGGGMEASRVDRFRSSQSSSGVMCQNI